MVHVPPSTSGAAAWAEGSCSAAAALEAAALDGILQCPQQLLVGSDTRVWHGQPPGLVSEFIPVALESFLGEGSAFCAFTGLGVVLIVSHVRKGPRLCLCSERFSELPALLSISPMVARPKPKLGEAHGKAPCPQNLAQPLGKRALDQTETSRLSLWSCPWSQTLSFGKCPFPLL